MSLAGDVATVGITDHAQKALGDVVYCELPPSGRALKKGETFGVVESIKAVSDLYAPITGKVTASNSAVTDEPAILNRAPHSDDGHADRCTALALVRRAWKTGTAGGFTAETLKQSRVAASTQRSFTPRHYTPRRLA